ncbi:MAG: phenylalanine--tRNA ligase subunit alpha [Longimicrobiales bacterium]
MQSQLMRLEAEAREVIARAESREAVERARVAYLGRKEGRLSAVLRGLGSLDAAARPAVGAEANRVKTVLTQLLDARAAELASSDPRRREETPDLTMPGRSRWRGAAHPVVAVIDEICDALAPLGFTRRLWPEVETEWYNFVALNTPLDHPAADAHDTFYLRGPYLLRSHTSPGQIRTMQQFEPPVRIVIPGMCYRRDPYDASHAPAFDQIEGLAVDEGISFVDLKATLAEFARRLFGPASRVRFRPSYFPFTEPSAEVDVSCTICGGRGCSSCKQTGWLEIMGAGMVDPAVFEHVGYDPERYTGFAFGMGPARIAMLKHAIPDIRLFYESDVRFLEQFADA